VQAADESVRFAVLTAYLTAYSGHSVTCQDALWHERVTPPNTSDTPWHALTRPGKEGQSPLNPKVQGSIPCASTNMLCLRYIRAPHVVVRLLHCVTFAAFDSFVCSCAGTPSVAHCAEVPRS
jgi:hypothetical protein